MKTLFENKLVKYGAILVAVILVLVLPLVAPPFLNYQLAKVAVIGVALLGLNIVMGYTGQVSLGQSFFLGLGAYITTYGLGQGWNWALIFLLAALMTGVIGMLIALIAARFRGLALAMITIALPVIGVPLAKRLSDFTGGSMGVTVSWLKSPFPGLENDQWRYYVILAIATIFFILGRNLVRGKMGRAFAIVKSNESVAISMGVSPYRYKVIAFTIASLYGGVAGFLFVGAVQFTSPETLNFGTSINLVIAMVIGGAGSIVGTVLGAVYYVFLPVIAGSVSSSQTAIISGAALLIVLFLLPDGLVSLPRRISQAIAKRRGSRAPDAQPSPPVASTPSK